MSDIDLGFLLKPVLVPIENILPSKATTPTLMETQKYRQIKSSIVEIDLIEPLSVGPVDRKTGQHVLFDGHVRLVALRELEWAHVPCLIAKDDETYTYNNRVNRLSAIQEHIMIRQAVAKGVSPERLAAALCVDISAIRKKIRLMNGICPEVIELLKDMRFIADIPQILRKMKPTRQLECVELMISANSLTVPYAQALLAATPRELLTIESKREQPKGVTQEQMLKMEKEMSSLQSHYRAAEETYGEDMLNLVLAKGYISKLLANPQVERFMVKHEPAVLEEFNLLIKAVSSDPLNALA